MNVKSVSAYRLTKSSRDARLEFPVASVRHSFPVVAMAASVGGLKALSIILGGLPENFPAAIAIVMHLAPDHKSLLAEILNCRTPLVSPRRTPEMCSFLPRSSSRRPIIISLSSKEIV